MPRSASQTSPRAGLIEKIQDFLLDYPSIKREDILPCLDCAASLAEEEVTPLNDVVPTQ
jgi:hypothetical protein